MKGGFHSTVMVELVLLIVVRSSTNSGTNNIKNDAVTLFHIIAYMSRVSIGVGGFPSLSDKWGNVDVVQRCDVRSRLLISNNY